LDSASLIRERYPILFETSTVVADPVVRNWATVGGNIAHADPDNDHPASMLAMGAKVVAAGPAGERIISIEEFFTDVPFETTLRPNELLTEIRVPAPVPGSGGAYVKLERKVGDYAIAGVAAYIVLDANRNVTYAGIGLTNVGQTPIKARNAEQALLGKPLNDASIHQAADLAAAASQPISDTRGPADYKRDMVHTLTVRALRKAFVRATGGE
jgi:carbon-monoxide dehydrogenase medium subunit